MRLAQFEHHPVMPEQVLRLLRPRSGGKYVDLTLGLGGHAQRILKACTPDGLLLGIDRDPQALELAEHNLAGFGSRVRSVHGPYSELPSYLRELGWEQVDGILADLGVSSLQLDRAERGFSFQQAGPLDMRMDPATDATLGELLAREDEQTLARALREFGQVKPARAVARRILRAHRSGELKTTADLARVSSEGPRTGRRHPATRVFQALRILVNREIEELSSLLEALPDPLAVGGRIVFIAFHSVEDRMIKRRLADLEGRCACPPGLPSCRCGATMRMRRIHRRALRPTEDEIRRNPRSRSASLRAAERVAA